MGSMAAVCGLLTGVYYLVRHFTGSITTPGYASIIVSILILGGLQLLGMGIIGEYLGRLHLNVNEKPQYRERHVLAAADRPSCPDFAGDRQTRSLGS